MVTSMSTVSHCKLQDFLSSNNMKINCSTFLEMRCNILISSIQVHLRRVMHRDRFMRKSSIAPAIQNRIWRDLIHNPLHLIFSVDVLGMTSSTLSSLSKGFAELSTDGQFLQLRSKQVCVYFV